MADVHRLDSTALRHDSVPYGAIRQTSLTKDTEETALWMWYSSTRQSELRTVERVMPRRHMHSLRPQSF